MRRGLLITTGLTTLALALGCSGMSGYGKEFGSADVYDGDEFALVFTTASEKSYDLWLEYEIDYYESDWELKGPILMQVGENSAGTWRVDFNGEDPPVSGEGERIVIDGKRVLESDVARATGTVFLAALPSQNTDTEVLLTGTLTAGDDTVLRRGRLVVTN